MSNIIIKLIKQPGKIFYGFQKLGLMDWMSDEDYIKFSYRMIFGRKLDLDNPQAYTEKIAWCKLHWRSELAATCTDKYLVRRYIEEKLGDDSKKYLNEVYGVWENVKQIDIENLPEKFVIRPTNGTGDVVICEDKKNFNWEKEKMKLLKNRNNNFAKLTKEWVYYNLSQKFLVEKYIESSDGQSIRDYKFYCFHGIPKFLCVCSERNIKLKLNYYDLEWNPLDVIDKRDRLISVPKPDMFDEMIELAKILSQDFPHVRVDLYQENGSIYFGELTFFDAGGFAAFQPDEYDYIFGKYFDINKIPKNELV